VSSSGIVLLVSADAIEGHFEGKTPREGYQRCLVLARKFPLLTHHALATQKKLAYLGSQYFDHPPYSPDLAPSDYHLFPGLKKKQLNGCHFSSDADVIAAVEIGLDGQLSDFFEWLAKVRATG